MLLSNCHAAYELNLWRTRMNMMAGHNSDARCDGEFVHRPSPLGKRDMSDVTIESGKDRKLKSESEAGAGTGSLVKGIINSKSLVTKSTAKSSLAATPHCGCRS